MVNQQKGVQQYTAYSAELVVNDHIYPSTPLLQFGEVEGEAQKARRKRASCELLMYRPCTTGRSTSARAIGRFLI